MSLVTNIVSYWKFDESSGNASDATGNGNTATNSGVSYSTGKINNGADFEASGSNSMTVADSTSVRVVNGWSLAGWVKLESAHNGYIFNARYGENGWGIGCNTDRKITVFAGSGVFENTIGTTVLSLDTWYHVAVYFNGSTTKLYINGTLDSTLNNNNITNPNTALYLGRKATSADDYYDGMIDELGVWSRELTSTEVGELYNSGAGLQYPFITSQPPVLDTASATTITDVSAILNGEITDVGLENADYRGFVWSETSQSDPADTAPASSAYSDYWTESGSFSAEVFDHAIASLTPSTTYYVRACAHNADGWAYGDEVSFATEATPPWRFENIAGVIYDETDKKTIFAERLNEILDRLHDLDGLNPN
jgi:hypothetical protein